MQRRHMSKSTCNAGVHSYTHTHTRRGGPSQLVPAALLQQDGVWELDAAGLPGGVPACLAALARELGVQPGASF